MRDLITPINKRLCNANMTFGVFRYLIFMRGTRCDKAVLVARCAYIKPDFFCRFQQRATKNRFIVSLVG